MNIHKQGRFTAVIERHGFSTATTGTQQFWVEFKTGEGLIIGYFPLTDRAVEGTLKKIRTMGFQGEDLALLADGNELFGNWVDITVDHEEYKGKVQAKVGYVNAVGAQIGPKNNPKAAIEVAKAFNALLRKTAKVMPVKERPQEARAVEAEAPFPADEDPGWTAPPDDCP